MKDEVGDVRMLTLWLSQAEKSFEANAFYFIRGVQSYQRRLSLWPQAMIISCDQKFDDQPDNRL